MSVQTLSSIKKALNTLSPKQVREWSEQPIRLALHASSDASYSAMESFLLQDLRPTRREESGQLLVRGANPITVSPALTNAQHIDVYDVHSATPTNALVLDLQHPQPFLRRTLERYPDTGVALSRHFLPFRRPFIHQVISKTARENTLFSVATALPDVVPSIIELPWAVAEFASDTAFLTMNQVRMAFLIAAASNREVGYLEQKSEVATVVASAFGWRAIARQLVGKIPFGGGLIAKAGVAYAGTKVLGLSLERFHSIGFTYTREERDRLYKDAFHQGKNLATRIISYSRPDLAAKFSREDSKGARPA